MYLYNVFRVSKLILYMKLCDEKNPNSSLFVSPKISNYFSAHLLILAEFFRTLVVEMVEKVVK